MGPFANLQILWSKIVVYKSLDQSRGSTISHFVKRQKILNHQSKKFQTQHGFGIIVQSVISRVIFGIPPTKHTFNPETRADFAFKSRIRASNKGNAVSRKTDPLRTLLIGMGSCHFAFI